MVRMLPCHGRGRGFESRPLRISGSSSFGRAIAFQAIGGQFEPGLPLKKWIKRVVTTGMISSTTLYAGVV